MGRMVVMKLNLSGLLFFAFIFCLSTNVFAQDQDSERAAVLGLIEKYDHAWNTKDSKTVSDVLGSEYIYFSSTGNLSNRAQTLEFLKSPDYKLTFAERSEVKLYRTGETFVVSSRWKGRGTYNNREINDDQRCGLVFAREMKVWKLVSEHCVQIPTK